MRSEALHLGSLQCLQLSLLLRSSRVLLLLLLLPLLLLPLQHLLPHHLEQQHTAVGS